MVVAVVTVEVVVGWLVPGLTWRAWVPPIPPPPPVPVIGTAMKRGN